MAIQEWHSGRIVCIWILTLLIFLVFAVTVDDVLYPTGILLLCIWLLSALIAGVITWIWLGRGRRDEPR